MPTRTSSTYSVKEVDSTSLVNRTRVSEAYLACPSSEAVSIATLFLSFMRNHLVQLAAPSQAVKASEEASNCQPTAAL